MTVSNVYDLVEVRSLTHLPDTSTYNRNYYHDPITEELLFEKSDDDMTSEWFLIMEAGEHIYIGYSTLWDDVEVIYAKENT